MPPKSREFKPKKAKQSSSPQSEIEFLDAAEDFEQAGGKWRAGDSAKAARFFQRAIQVYDEGLKRFPKSFDIAYNKAHLEYESCEDERIVPHLGDKVALLQETLTSHRTAFALNPENHDIRFNTGQVLVSLAEAVLEKNSQAEVKVPVRGWLEEAADLFVNCLEAQLKQYEQMRVEIAKMQEEQAALAAGGDVDVSASGSGVQEQSMDTEGDSAASEWATVEEALTPEVILDTCGAQLGALTALIGLYDSADFAAFEKRVHEGLHTTNTGIPTLVSLIDNAPSQEEQKPAGPTLSLSSVASEEPAPSSQDDAHLAAASFQVAVTDFSYRSAQITAPQYLTTITTLFKPLSTPQSQQPTPAQVIAVLNAQFVHADALIELSSSIIDSPSAASDIETQWDALSQAQTILTRMSKPPASEIFASRIVDTYAARGDVELTRFRLALLDGAKPSWKSSAITLVGNARVFYRGARTYAERAGASDLWKTMGAKATVAEVLKEVAAAEGATVVAKAEWKAQGDDVRKALEEMVEDRTLTEAEGQGVLGIVWG